MHTYQDLYRHVMIKKLPPVEESLFGEPLSPRLVAWPLGTGAVRQPPHPLRGGASSLLFRAYLRHAGAVSWRRPRRINSLHARRNDDDGDDDDEQQCSSSPRPHHR